MNGSMFGVRDRLLLSGPPHEAGADGLMRVMTESTPPWEGTLRASASMPYADYYGYSYLRISQCIRADSIICWRRYGERSWTFVRRDSGERCVCYAAVDRRRLNLDASRFP